VADPQAKAIGDRFRAEIAIARNEIDANLRAATPVDTGRAHANWARSVDSPVLAEVQSAAAHDSGVAAALGAKLTDDVRKQLPVCDGPALRCNIELFMRELVADMQKSDTA
jgi:hypothetical protein